MIRNPMYITMITVNKPVETTEEKSGENNININNVNKIEVKTKSKCKCPCTIPVAQMQQSSVGVGGSCNVEQTAKFYDSSDQIVARMSTGVDPTSDASSAPNASLAEFLARPVQIHTQLWQTGVSPNFQIYPWQLWAAASTSNDKLNNYSLFRGDLMVKIMINGSPFHYGKCIMHYYPLKDFSQLAADDYTATLHTPAHIAVLCKATQRQHILVDPSTSTGGCMCLPFIWPKNRLRIINSNDFSNMGKLYLTAMADIKSTGATLSEPEIMVYAWVENAKVEIPTRTAAAGSLLGMLVAQSEFDEQRGAISGPAAVVAGIAGKLENAPFIGPFALASKLGAEAVGGIAKIFGYSRPADIVAPAKVRREPDGGLANVSGFDTVNKLSLDPKAEVTVDPAVVGLGPEDEMSIKSIIERDALLTQFSWAVGETSGNLLNMSVSPYVANMHDSDANQYLLTPTPLAFASTPFQWWSGTIIYRFEVMCSAMHRGRLGISFDPSNTTTSTNPNACYMVFLDLAETKNVEIAVSWASDQPMLEVLPTAGRVQAQLMSPTVTPLTKLSLDNANGYISVNIVNGLNCNIASSSVVVNVYQRAGEDFRFSGPVDRFRQVSYHPWAGSLLGLLVAQGETDVTDNEPDSAPIKAELVGPTMDRADMMAAIYSGDPIVSFRSLLKRYCLNEAVTSFLAGTAGNLATYRFEYIEPNFPRYYGYDTSGLYEVGVAKPFTPALTTLMNYLTPAYVCRRGSTRVKYFPAGQTYQAGNVMTGKAVRSSHEIASAYIASQRCVSTFPNGLFSNAQTVMDRDDNCFGGASVEVQDAQKSFVLELPYYNNRRFLFAQRVRMNTGSPNDGSETQWHTLSSLRKCEGTEAEFNDCSFEKWVAAGDDFSLSLFLNAPTQYHYAAANPLITQAVLV